MTLEATRQQLDPAITAGARMSTIVLAVLSFAWAVGMSLAAEHQDGAPFLVVTALILLAGACAIVVYASHPLRAPFTRAAHIAVHAVVALSFFAETWADWARQQHILDDWVPVSLGLLAVAMSPYRPARELAVLGTASAALMGLVTLLKVEHAANEAPALAFTAVGILPLLVLSYGSARFTKVIVDLLVRWQLRSGIASEALADELRDDITHSVQEDRVTILGTEVAPFFTTIMARDELVDADRTRARQISAAIRGVMVAEIDRSWLNSAIDGSTAQPRWPLVVEDPDHLAPLIDGRERTSLRALMVAIADDPVVEGMTVRLAADDLDGHTGSVTMISRASERAVRLAYEPFLAVVRIVFPTLTVEITPPTLIARFSF